MTEASAPALPDRLSIDPRSPHHVAAVFERDIGIRFNGKERFDVEEYCISEGWVKVPAGKTVDRKGHPLLIKLKDRKSTRLNSSHIQKSRMPSSA